MNEDLEHVIIYTDGSCLGNPGKGGWAARLEHQDVKKYLSGGFKRTTNNRMEIYAVLMALGALKRPCKVDLYTDSRYVCDTIEKRWIYGWQKRNWIKADKKPVLNRDLWERLLLELRKHDVSLHWVAGHSGHDKNEEVDLLAREEAGKPDLPEDTGFSS